VACEEVVGQERGGTCTGGQCKVLPSVQVVGLQLPPRAQVDQHVVACWVHEARLHPRVRRFGHLHLHHCCTFHRRGPTSRCAVGYTNSWE
jgi:hypothetical protein